MLPLNVPFLPETPYIRFLNNLGPRLHAVHFSLHDPLLCDARVRLGQSSLPTLIGLLARLPGPKKYLLANGRFQPTGTYTGSSRLSGLIVRLERLLDAGVLDGLIFADSYLLTALGDAAPAVVARLEAIPSVNFSIDSMGKLIALMDLVAANGFRLPGKITLDRELNRRPAELALLSTKIRRRWPMVKIELLANEGCLMHCPFRSTHEALIAATNNATRSDGHFDTQRLNGDLACRRQLTQSPHRILSSPFIRPEDVHRYEGSADLIKVCGRTLGTGFLQRLVKAYVQGHYRGNLLDLLDAAHWMSDRWDIANGNIPEDFLDILSTCEQECAVCNFCRTYFDHHVRSKQLQLQDWRNLKG
jgi:collagenase-like PrtC family protease